MKQEGSDIVSTVSSPILRESIPGMVELEPGVVLADQPVKVEPAESNGLLKDLKGKTARSALVSVCGQGANFVLRIGSMMILARMLVPEDFGLVGMATACTGFLELFRDAGLSMAAIQCNTITHAQTSTLFWINVVVGFLLAVFCAASAPLLTYFYHEPRLFWITVLIGAGFVCSGAAAQHRALLQREMRFAALTLIDVLALVFSVAAAIAMAARGYGYWSLVGMSIVQSVSGLLGLWLASRWMPGLPQRRCGVHAMLRYGGTVTLNSVLVYIAYNTDKVLLGRFGGAAVLGVYGRAYQFISLPTAILNTTIGQVAFPALSRLQDDPARLRSYFLKGYGLFLALVTPITVACLLFARDMVLVFLGAKWIDAVPVFRWLAPTIIAFALINPFGWFLLATGHAARSLKIALLLTPVVILGYLCGLSSGSQGVAVGFSIAMVGLIVPVIAWAKQGTSISAGDIAHVIAKPFLAAAIAACVALALGPLVASLHTPFWRLLISNLALFSSYGLVLWFGLGQKNIYLTLLADMGVWPVAKRRRTV